MEEKALNIYQRILAVMNDVRYVQKSDKKVNGQYTFVTHDAVTATIHPALVEHGIVCLPNVLSFKQDGNRTEVCLNVRFINVDDPKDYVEIQSWGYGIDSQDKGPGKAVSYAFKYAILKLFCLETGDDPEQDLLTDHEPAKPKQPNPTKEEIASRATKFFSRFDTNLHPMLRDYIQEWKRIHEKNDLDALEKFEPLSVDVVKEIIAKFVANNKN